MFECYEFKIAVKSIVSRIRLGRVLMNFTFAKRSIWTLSRLIKWETSLAVSIANVNRNGGPISNHHLRRTFLVLGQDIRCMLIF